MGLRRAGDLIGLCDDAPVYFCNVDAITDVTIRYVRVQVIAQQIPENPDLLPELLQTFSAEFDDARFQLSMLRRHSALEKVAALVLRYLRSHERTPDQGIRPDMSRSDIADFLDLTVETVSRSLTRLKTIHIIGIPDSRVIFVKDASTLTALAIGELHFE
jgi:CRP-like cAMP-binding protein